MLALVVTLKLLNEIAVLSLTGQGIVGLLSGQAKARNPIYRLFQWVSQPWIRAARWACPRVVLNRHVPLVAVFLLLVLWATATIAKVSICVQMGAALCK